MGEAVATLLAAHDARVAAAGRHRVSGSPVPVIEADLASPEGADHTEDMRSGLTIGEFAQISRLSIRALSAAAPLVARAFRDLIECPGDH
jgi:hypothetical protein